MNDAAAANGAGKPALFSERYKALVLAFLVATYTFNFIDRTIIATIGPAIREELKLTSAQIGLLGGLYFALLYTILGIPIARLAERASRTWIITVALVVWSGFTSLCGAAQNFAQLALMRFGVGVGEAGCSPPAHSLISDYYPPKRRATALSIYAMGVPLGSMIGAVAGGYLAQNFSWRVAFLIVGLPGVLLALLFKLFVKEPPRGHADAVEQPLSDEDLTAPPAGAGFSLWEEVKELAAVTTILFGSWPVLNMILGVTLASFAGYGVGQFAPQYFRMAFNLDLAHVGLIVGLVFGFSSGIGTLLGGLLTDQLRKHSAAWYALTPAIGLVIATPIYLAAYSQPTWQAAALILLVPGIFHYTYLGPTFGVVQNMVEARRRATATAIMFFFLNLLALGGGPPFTGWLIDQFAAHVFASNGASDVLSSVSAMLKGADHGAAFAAACPGGLAPPGAGAAEGARCHAALSEATRQGIVVTLFFFAWAAFHYFLGAIGLSKTLAEAAKAQAR